MKHITRLSTALPVLVTMQLSKGGNPPSITAADASSHTLTVTACDASWNPLATQPSKPIDMSKKGVYRVRVNASDVSGNTTESFTLDRKDGTKARGDQLEVTVK